MLNRETSCREISLWFKKVAKADCQDGWASEDNGNPPAAVLRGVCQSDAHQQDIHKDQAQEGEAHGDSEGSTEGRLDEQGQGNTIKSTRSVSQLPTHNLVIYCYNLSTHSVSLAAIQAAKAPIKFPRQVMSCWWTVLLNFHLTLSPLGYLTLRFVLSRTGIRYRDLSSYRTRNHKEINKGSILKDQDKALYILSLDPVRNQTGF